MTEFVNHKIKRLPGQEGKGFILKPGRAFPQLAGAYPIVWTWPTKDLRPTHAQMKVHSTYEAPHGMLPDENSYFHIRPDGGVFVYGAGRHLSPGDHAAIQSADPELWDAAKGNVEVEPDDYGHANRLLKILEGTRIGRWIEWPQRWRKN